MKGCQEGLKTIGRFLDCGLPETGNGLLAVRYIDLGEVKY